ncbi:FLYWCH zinc finger domain-containing protein [Phthorimaea operculella]|nr:FLYWCH zinc finger domain-containing protein [Phthorimaea operculella]
MHWKGVKYRVNGAQGLKVRWRCATHQRFHCRAIVHTVGDEVVYCKNDHSTSAESSPNPAATRRPQLGMEHMNKEIYFKVSKTIEVPEPIFTQSRLGRPVLLLGCYRFNKYIKCTGPKARWICSKQPACKAIVVTVEDQIIHMTDHTH